MIAIFPGCELIAQENAAQAETWFNYDRVNTLVMAVILCIAILAFVQQATAGRDFYIRKIAGLDTVEEAVGRATEMGKPILYVPGLADMDNVQTIAWMMNVDGC